MKKWITLLVLPVTLIVAVTSTLVLSQDQREDKSAESEEVQNIDGTWVRVTGRYQEGETFVPSYKELGYYKVHAGNQYFVIQILGDTVLGTHGGSLEVDGNKITTTIQFADEGRKSIIGESHSFYIEVEDNYFYQKGMGDGRLGQLEELWMKVE